MPLALLLTGIVSLAVRPATVHDSASQDSSASAVRSCYIADVTAKSSRGRGKNKKGSDQKMPAEPNSCLEVHSTALDIQEYLQAHAREQKWNIADEHVAEDSWTFVRILEKDELLNFTKSDANSARVMWTSGRAFVQVRTMQLKDGFTRMQISAHFRGYGKSADQFAPPRDSWPLDSNGTLEFEIRSALEVHVRSMR